MPDPTYSEALREAIAYADPGVVIYHTVEVWHPTFSEPLYVVRDEIALDARIEAGAARNAGEVVSFVPVRFDIVPPAQTATATPVCEIEIDNIDPTIGALLLAASQTVDPTWIIYRQYLSGAEDDGPQNDPPMAMTLKSAKITPFRIVGQAGFRDLQNRRYPRAEFTLLRFPALALA